MVQNAESNMLEDMTVSANNRDGQLHTYVYCNNSLQGNGSLELHDRFQANKLSTNNKYSIIYDKADTQVRVVQ